MLHSSKVLNRLSRSCNHLFVCLCMFQGKFQVCTIQRNWSLSSPPSKMLLHRMDLPDHSTTTFLIVSTVYLSTAQTLCLFFIHYFGLVWSKMDHVGLTKTTSRLHIALYVTLISQLCRNSAEPPHCSYHGLLQLQLHHQL